MRTKGVIVVKKRDLGPPKDPRIGQLYFEPVTRTMRKWNGKHWEEINRKQLQEAVRAICKEDE